MGLLEFSGEELTHTFLSENGFDKMEGFGELDRFLKIDRFC